MKERAYITADNLNIRETPSTDGQIVGKCLQGELHEIVGEENGWYKISGGYISADYAEKRFCMNEANKLDMKAMVLNFYDRPGVSNVSNYLNIRAGAGENEKIIGKLPSYAGCEILEDANGWYKISSGGITGYVKSDYILTGDEAKQAAMNHAELMAIVHADRLNARTEPSTDAKIWTQISVNERYHVAEQLDGWVKIEFDESGEGDGDDEISAAYVSSEFVEVRYALSRGDQVLADGGERVLKEPDRKLRDEIPWKSVCMGRNEPHKGSGLLRIYNVRHEELRNLPPALFRIPGKERKTDQVERDASG